MSFRPAETERERREEVKKKERKKEECPEMLNTFITGFWEGKKWGLTAAVFQRFDVTERKTCCCCNLFSKM